MFRDMMKAVSSSYGDAFELAERGYDTEALMMSILLIQQKTINWLSDLAKRLEETRGQPPCKSQEGGS